MGLEETASPIGSLRFWGTRTRTTAHRRCSCCTIVDFVTSLDGYGAAEGWPGWWGLQGPEYLEWLGERPDADYTVLMGANTYRLMSGLADEGEPGTDALAGLSKVVFSTTLKEPLAWPNTRLVNQDAVEVVRRMTRAPT